MGNNFADAEPEYSDYEKSKVVVLPVAFEGTVSYGKGTSSGPKAIIEASKNFEWFDEGRNIAYVGINTAPEINEKKVEKVLEKIYSVSKKFIADGKFVVMLGGEHSITPGLVKAYKEKFPDLSVLQIDAHSDLRDEYEFEKNSHACAMKRVMDLGIKVVQVGIRSTSEEEKETFDRNRKNIFLAKDIYDNDRWIDEAVSRLSKNVFVTIDVDGFDSSIMPATGTPEPGGLQWYQVLKLMQKLAERKKVVGFDVVELAPIKGMHAPDYLCAKLVYKLIGYFVK